MSRWGLLGGGRTGSHGGARVVVHAHEGAEARPLRGLRGWLHGLHGSALHPVPQRHSAPHPAPGGRPAGAEGLLRGVRGRGRGPGPAQGDGCDAFQARIAAQNEGERACEHEREAWRRLRRARLNSDFRSLIRSFCVLRRRRRAPSAAGLASSLCVCSCVCALPHRRRAPQAARTRAATPSWRTSASTCATSSRSTSRWAALSSASLTVCQHQSLTRVRERRPPQALVACARGRSPWAQRSRRRGVLEVRGSLQSAGRATWPGGCHHTVEWLDTGNLLPIQVDGLTLDTSNMCPTGRC
jgi:hypothetical protein